MSNESNYKSSMLFVEYDKDSKLPEKVLIDFMLDELGKTHYAED